MQTLRLGIRPKTAEVAYRESLTLKFIPDYCVLRDMETLSIPFLEFIGWRDKYSTGKLTDYYLCLTNRIGVIRVLTEKEIENIWYNGVDTIFRGGRYDVNYSFDLDRKKMCLEILGVRSRTLDFDYFTNCIENPVTYEGWNFWIWTELAGPRIYEALLDMVKKGYIDKKYYDRFRSQIM